MKVNKNPKQSQHSYIWTNQLFPLTTKSWISVSYSCFMIVSGGWVGSNWRNRRRLQMSLKSWLRLSYSSMWAARWELTTQISELWKRKRIATAPLFPCKLGDVQSEVPYKRFRAKCCFYNVYIFVFMTVIWNYCTDTFDNWNVPDASWWKKNKNTLIPAEKGEINPHKDLHWSPANNLHILVCTKINSSWKCEHRHTDCQLSVPDVATYPIWTLHAQLW